MLTETNLKTTLVMVDDDAEDVLMLRTAARHAGHEVRILHMAAGREFLDAFSQASLPERCVVLLDLNMPAMDGFAVLDRLRRLPRGELLPVVVFTSSSDQVHVERAFASGANAFLTKPSTLKETSELMGALVTHWLVHGQVPAGALLPQERTVADPRPAQRLLVVSTQEDLVDEVGGLLRGMGRSWEIDGLSRLEDLAPALSSGRYDAWLLDQGLVHQAANWVAKIPLEARPPVVLVTTSQDKDLEALHVLAAVDGLTRAELRPALLDRTLRFAVAQWRSQRALERSQQELLRSERMATIGRMASGVAHEYNNLNAVILAGLERLDQHIIGDQQAHQLIGRVLGAIERSRRISESLMTLGRSSQGVNGVINLRLHLSDTLALLDLRARRQGAKLRLDSCDTPCVVHIDSNDLHQVLSNLVVNALHAVHAASDPTVVVRLELRERKAFLSVSDNGVGIPAEDMPRLFQPFFSRKAVQGRNGLYPENIEGTGLGLSVCQVLVQRAGGELTVNSRAGLGTTVTVVLPLADESQVKPAVAVAVEDPPSLLAATQTRVVVLDDNAMLCQLLHEALSGAGFQVRSHIDPRQFIAEEDLSQIDILILDWLMPGMTGGQVLQRLGDPRRKVPLRVLVVSGEEPAVPAVPPGVELVGVLLKPYRVGDLISRLTGI
jgi:signal transduction histidine kinase